jgi:acetyl-CoA acetyltransferase
VLAAPVSVPYAKHSPHGAEWWIARALRGALEQAGVSKAAIDGFCCSSFSLGMDSAVGLTQHFGLTLRWLDHIPMGGASGVVAIRRAARAVQAGDAEIVACVAGDTASPDSFRQMLEGFSRFSAEAVYPYAAGGPNLSFALLTEAYMRRTGATRADFGRVCVAQRENALRYPHALMKRPLTMEEYLGARPIADPIVLFDCVMPCAGAEGFLVMREARARDLGIPFVHLRAAMERHHSFPDDDIQARGGWLLDRDELWAMAGCGPADVSLVQTYDDYPVIVLMQLEGLGFCEDGAAFVRARDLTVDGDFPHNTSGGQLSVGQAGAAGGHLGIVEAIRQLTGMAGGTQVEGARIAAVSGFGMINYDRGLCCGAVVLSA